MFLCFAVATGSLAATLALLLRRHERYLELGRLPMVYVLALAVLALWGGTAEMMRLDVASRFIMLWWAAIGLAGVVIGLKRSLFGVLAIGLVIQTLVAVWLLHLYYGHTGGMRLPLANDIFLCFTLGLLSLAATLALLLHEDDLPADRQPLIPVYVVLVSLLSVWGLTAEAMRALGQVTDSPGLIRFGVSLLWCLCAAGLIGIGMSLRYPLTRLLGVVLFALTILKVFLYDSWYLESIWRALSAIALGVILIGVTYLYYLYRERVKEFIGRTHADEETREETGT